MAYWKTTIKTRTPALRPMVTNNLITKLLSSGPSSFVRAYMTKASTERAVKRMKTNISTLPILNLITSLQVKVLSLGSSGGIM